MQDNFRISKNIPLFSHGVVAFLLSWTLTSTWSWQGLGQTCPQAIFFWHICLQGWHGPKWQEWGDLDSWWQSGGFLHFCLHFGGLVDFSIPQGTSVRLVLQLQETSCKTIYIRGRPRFFDQVGHQTTNASSGNKYFFTK